MIHKIHSFKSLTKTEAILFHRVIKTYEYSESFYIFRRTFYGIISKRHNDILKTNIVITTRNT